MTATVGLVLTTFGVADGGRRAKCRTRTGRGQIEVIAEVPPGFDVADGQEVDLEHAHGDVWTIRGHAVDVRAPGPAVDDTDAARKMVQQIREAFGPVEIRVFETGPAGRVLVSSNVKGEVSSRK